MQVGGRYTVYDVMEAKKVFQQNPANSSSPVHKRQDFPKMLYHPKGEERIVVPGVQELTPWGEKRMVGQQFEIINRVVVDAVEEAEWLRKGWHKHPADAMVASGKVGPATVSEERLVDIDEQIKRLTEERERAKKAKIAHALANPDEDVA